MVGKMKKDKPIMQPFLPQSSAEDGVLLVLDNGVRIESGDGGISGRGGAGDYVMVVDAQGYEIGYWNSEEWRDEPVAVMGAILILAAKGHAPD